MKKCKICGQTQDKVRLLKAHTIPRFLDKGPGNKELFTICMDCELERSQKEYSIFQSYNISENKEFYNIFIKSSFEIDILAEDRSIRGKLKQTLERMLYANIISSIETFLSDAFINIVLSDPQLIRKVVETSPEFKKRKFDSIESDVWEYLVNIIYHNLSKVEQLYKSVLNIEFPSNVSELYKAIQVRHDVVHRNGKDKDGSYHSINKETVLELNQIAREFIKHINLQLPANA